MLYITVPDQHWHSGHHWHSVLVAMNNIGTVDIIGTVFGGHGQHWYSGHHWHSVLAALVDIGTMDIIGTVFWLSWSTAQWSSLAQCFGCHGQHAIITSL